MQYKILSSNSLEKLEEKVSLSIQNGWEPQGGMTVLYYKYEDGDNGWDYFQAMIRK